jgi:hypothetical protein
MAAASALILAACSDTATTSPSKSISPGSPSLDQESNEMIDATGRHLFRTKPWFANQAANGNGHKPGGSTTGISYHGGSVLQSGTKVVAVYWASAPIYNGGPAAGTTGTGSDDGSLVGTFLRALGGSSYYNINSTYWDSGLRNIVNSVTYTGYWANNANVPINGQSVSDAQMVAMLQSGFNSGALTYDDHTLYAIFTAGTVNLGGGFGTQYCAYHTHGTVSIPNVGTRTVLYAAMPYDYSYPGACTNGTAAPNADPGADAEVNTLAHETEETTTDMMGNAWYDNRGYENADKCAWNWGGTYSNGVGIANLTIGGKDYLIQQNWVNAGSGGCAKGH